ncbi:MAG: S53 family peptidase [Nevskia sp.]|nr:S53 family peptidase [Nevskia sp.]
MAIILPACRRFLPCALAAICAAAGRAPQSRIVDAPDARSSVVLRGSAHPLAQARYAAGPLDGTTVLHGISLNFAPSPAQQAELDELLRELQDPVSPNYQAWLTPAEFDRRFGLSPADLAKVQDWLRGQGFAIDEATPLRVRFGGSVAQVEAAFQTRMQHYRLGGEMHFAYAGELSLPAALSSVVAGVDHLDDFRPKPRLAPAQPRFTSSISGNHYLVPDDFATIYDLKALYSAGIDGAGRKIAVVGQSAILVQDVRNFRSNSGLAANDPVMVLVPNTGASTVNESSGDENESDLDVEWSGGVAPAATIEFVYVGNSSNSSVFDALTYAIDQQIAPLISISYGNCEANFPNGQYSGIETELQKANALGETVFVASGDSGAADCDYPTSPGQTVSYASHGLAVDYPASSVYATGVGGTEFNDAPASTYWSSANDAGNGSALSYIPEMAWNDTFNSANSSHDLSASGGGVSTLFGKPSWQTGTGVPQDGRRDVPDVALPASNYHDQYLYCTSDASNNTTCVNGFRMADSTLTAAGGTSFGAPTFAGIIALVSQKLGANGLGNINPTLYQLAASTTNVFHDITSGNNQVCTTAGSDCASAGVIGYVAGTGYDLTTGLGSVDAANLANAWSTAGSGGGSSSGGSSSGSSSSGGTSAGSGSGGGGSSSSGGGAWSPLFILLLAGLGLMRRPGRVA